MVLEKTLESPLDSKEINPVRSLRPCSDSSATPSFPSQPEGKIGTRHVECFTARPGWILFLQMHQAILDSTTKVSLVPFQAGDGGRDPPWTFPPEGNHEVKGMDFL